jgi:hypothetical protein
MGKVVYRVAHEPLKTAIRLMSTERIESVGPVNTSGAENARS